MNVCQVAVVLMSFLDCENVEPAYDLGNELPVVARSLLDAEVRDVPCGDQQPVLNPGGDHPRLLVLSEMGDFVRDIVCVLERWLRERRHGAPLACVERRFWGRQRSIVRVFLRHERAEMRQATLSAAQTRAISKRQLGDPAFAALRAGRVPQLSLGDSPSLS